MNSALSTSLAPLRYSSRGVNASCLPQHSSFSRLNLIALDLTLHAPSSNPPTPSLPANPPPRPHIHPVAGELHRPLS